jgi:hypothetical protein
MLKDKIDLEEKAIDRKSDDRIDENSMNHMQNYL